jgi:hypothetical protein
MNLTLWVWGHWGIAIAASILLSQPVMAVTMTTQLSQRVSQQSGGNAAAAQKALDEAVQLYEQGTAEALRQAIAKLEEALKLY